MEKKQGMISSRTLLICLLIAFLLCGLGCSRDGETGLRGHVTAGVLIPEDAVSRILDRYHVPGLSIAVIHGGRIDWAKGYGLCEYGRSQRVDSTTLFQAASISKPVSAVVALRMVERGALDLDEDVNLKLRSWKVPENEFTRDEPVTLRRLLSHSAGLNMHGVPEFSAGAELPTLVQILNGERNASMEAVRPVVKPGTTYRYSGGGYIILQQLLTDVTGRPFALLARELVLQPAGMTASTYEQPLPQELWSHAAVGHLDNGTPVKGSWHILPEQAAGGLWTNPTNLASFVIELWRSYHGKSDTLLPQHLARLMLTRQIDDFGLGFSLPSEGIFRFQHGGSNAGYRCHLVLSVESGDGVVIMTNGNSGEKVINEVFQAIALAYGWKVNP
jgi:CubicO group peptidase (beta-lactamase class C family)